MAYVDRSLGDNEVVHYRARFPTVRYWIAWAALGLMLLLAYVAEQRGATASASVLTLTALAAFCAIMYRVWTSEIAITSQRLIYKQGFLRRVTNELQLKAIEEVRLHQDILGRLLNYGSIEFRGTGLDDLDLPALADPVAIQKAVQEAIGANHSQPINASDPPSRSGPGFGSPVARRA
jgi:uncharacterized membrane protein YdbT with pleckstrin-like domain